MKTTHTSTHTTNPPYQHTPYQHTPYQPPSQPTLTTYVFLSPARYQAVRSSVMYSIDYPHIKEAIDEYFEAGVKLLGYFKSRLD